MGLQNNEVIFKSTQYQVTVRIFKFRTPIPFVKRKIRYLVGYTIKDGVKYFDDAVRIVFKSSWLDPFQIIFTSGHVFLTRQALKKFGFNKADRAVCIASNMKADSREHFYKHQHYLPHTRDKSEDFLKMCLYMAVHSDHPLFWLGKGMHTLQDRFSHFEQNATLKDHMPFGKDPDNPAKHPYKYWQAYKHSVEYVREFLEKKQCLSINIFDFVKDTIPQSVEIPSKNIA